MKNYYFKERPRKKKKAILWCSCFQKKHIRQKTMLKKRVWWSVRSRQWGKSKCKLSSVILKAKAYSRPSRSQILPYKPFFFFFLRAEVYLCRSLQHVLLCMHQTESTEIVSVKRKKRPLLTPYAIFLLNIVVLSDGAFLLAYIDCQLTAKLLFVAFCLTCI